MGVLITKHSDELPDLDQNAKELIADGQWSLFEADADCDIKYVIVTHGSTCCGGKNEKFFLDKTGNVLSLSSLVEPGNPVILQGVVRTGVRIQIG